MSVKKGNGAALASMPKEVKRETLSITPPNMANATFNITGLSPLVIHRFSEKARRAMMAKMEAGSTARKGAKREPKDMEQEYNDARYISADGWDGFNAAAIRSAMISACRLVGFKMTLAKLSVFVEPDSYDAKEPQIPLIRIIGKPRRMDQSVRLDCGTWTVAARPCYDHWKAAIKVMYDADQFTLQDVLNLLARVGLQVGIGEGRPDSRNSAGMGWGLFRIDENK